MSEAEPGLPSPEPGPSQAKPMLPGGLGNSQKWHTHGSPPVLQVAEPELGLGAWGLVVSLQEGGTPLQQCSELLSWGRGGKSPVEGVASMTTTLGWASGVGA